jgi:hypothetical protein
VIHAKPAHYPGRARLIIWYSLAASRKFNKPEVFVTMAKSKLDEGTRALTDEPTREVIRQQLAAFSSFIAKVGGPA